MKHLTRMLFLLISIFCIGYIIVSARNKLLQIHKGGEVVQSFNVSDIDSITFIDAGDYENPEDEKGVVINGVRWATRNVGEPGRFVRTPEDYGNFYQWNRKTAWPSSGSVSGWDTSMPTGDTWSTENSPCPEGWRLPTKEEMQSLIDAGSVWTTVNGVPGRKYVDGENSIFIPACGNRNKDKGDLACDGYYTQYWTSTRYDAGNIYTLFGGSGSGSDAILPFPTNYGLPIRCVADDPTAIEVMSIELNTTHIDLKIGDKYQLTATVLPENATYSGIRWISLSSKIVSIDENGLITALAEGEGLIEVYAGNKHAACTVMVYDGNSYDEGIVINGIKWATRNVGEPGKFAETPEASGMLYQWDEYPGWSTEDGSVSVPMGSIWKEAEVGEEEYLDINAHWNTENNPCPKGWRLPTRSELESLVSSGYKKEIRNGVTGIAFGSGNNTIFLPLAGNRDRYLKNPSGYGLGGHYWSDTPNPNMLQGNVFSLQLSKFSDYDYRANVVGATSIYKGLSIRCVADAYVPVTSISINTTDLYLKIGDTKQLSATVTPDNASNKSVIWLSSDESIVSVNGNTGSVYAKKPGSATITAQVDNQVAKCNVTVSGVEQTGISLNKSKICLKVGESYNLIASITPPDATFNTVKWTSIDPSIATVDQNGKVKAIREGQTSISAATKSMWTNCVVTVDKIGGDGGSSSGNSGSVMGKTFSSAQLYYYGNLSSNTTYFRLSLFNLNEYDGLVIEGFCNKAYSFDNFILDPGTYTFSSTYGVAKTFIEGEYFGNPSENGHYMGSYYYRPNGMVLFNGGTVTISKSGNAYDISTNLSGYSNASTETYTNLNFKFSGVPEKIDYFK